MLETAGTAPRITSSGDDTTQGDGPTRLYRPRISLRSIALVLLAMLLGGGSALGMSSVRPRVYEAAGEVALERTLRDLVFDNGLTPARTVQTEVRVAQSAPVRDAVHQELGMAPPVAVLPVGIADAFEVRARSSDAASAARIANAYVNAYLRLRQHQAVDDVVAMQGQIRQQLDGIQREIAAIVDRILTARPEERTLLEYNFGLQRNALQAEEGVFRQQLDQLEVAKNLRTGGVTLLRPASEPPSPVEPNPTRDGAIGLALGLFVGLALTLLSDHRRPR